MRLDIDGTLLKWVDGVGTTPLAGTFDIRRPLSSQLESIVTSVIRRGYEEFIGKVAKARGKTPAQVDEIAQGRVWTGAQAKERGLVDKLGGLGDIGLRFGRLDPDGIGSRERGMSQGEFRVGRDGSLQGLDRAWPSRDEKVHTLTIEARGLVRMRGDI